MIQLRSIQYIVEVAHCGSIHKAAQKLYVSQPAITSCIRALEQELGIALFFREKQHLTLTPAGAYFVESGEKILASMEELQEGLAHFSRQANLRLQIGMSPFYGKHFFPLIYQAFHEICPDVEVNLVTADGKELQNLLLEKKLDFWFTAEMVEAPHLAKVLLMPEEIVLLYPKKLLSAIPSLGRPDNGDRVDLAALNRLPFILFDESHGLSRTIGELFQRSGFTPMGIFKTTSAEIIAGMVGKGLGAGFVPLTLAVSFCEEHPQTGWFSLDLYSPFHLIYNQKVPLTQIQRRFVNRVKKYFE